jgi:ribosomal protein S18 acetylase RimI-like enzyme
VGRLGLRLEPTTSDPAWLGSLPSHELSVFGLRLPWDDDYLKVGQALLEAARRTRTTSFPELIEARINRDVHDHEAERRRLFESWGLGLFQEKQGFRWEAGEGPVAVPGRLRFRSIAECGRDRYAAVMARGGAGTLDRNDRYYWTGAGPDNWAAQMLEYLVPEDEPLWLLGETDGQPVGYIAVVRVEDWGSTIGHVGVVPEHRGQGYINDLLAAGTAHAGAAGIEAMLSDVDVLNRPMIEAMRRNRHRDLDRWHVWSYRGPF